MGLEAECTARLGRQSSVGRAQLEEKEVVFRGTFRAKVPIGPGTTATEKGGTLQLEWPEGTLRLELGAAAPKWLEKIRNPRGRLDKLGVKEGMRVAIVGLKDEAFEAEVRARTKDVSVGKVPRAADLVIARMDRLADVERLRVLRQAIEPDGAVWVVWPKGVKAFREDDVRAAGPSAGLVDVKVMSFSAELSGLKLVVPVAQRTKR
ncbi:MAG: hypothetical protein ABW221_00050 [Vicinamibacteria bacterium]